MTILPVKKTDLVQMLLALGEKEELGEFLAIIDRLLEEWQANNLHTAAGDFFSTLSAGFGEGTPQELVVKTREYRARIRSLAESRPDLLLEYGENLLELVGSLFKGNAFQLEADLHFDLGVQLRAMGRFVEAEEHHERAGDLYFRSGLTSESHYSKFLGVVNFCNDRLRLSPDRDCLLILDSARRVAEAGLVGLLWYAKVAWETLLAHSYYVDMTYAQIGQDIYLLEYEQEGKSLRLEYAELIHHLFFHHAPAKVIGLAINLARRAHGVNPEIEAASYLVLARAYAEDQRYKEARSIYSLLANWNAPFGAVVKDIARWEIVHLPSTD